MVQLRYPLLELQKQRMQKAKAKKVPLASKIPSIEEDKEVMHEALMNAYRASVPSQLQISGLQEFAGAIWERRRRIPSTMYKDPLQHIFDEFDTDGDGSLSAAEVSAALQSRQVDITAEQAQVFIDSVDENRNGEVDREEFMELLLHMAAVDMRQDTHLVPEPIHQKFKEMEKNNALHDNINIKK